MITEPKHPWLMMTVLFLAMISAGVIIGYMAINMPEFPEVSWGQQKTSSGYTNLQSDSRYSTLYRSIITVDYNNIPEDSTVTNWSWTNPYGGDIGYVVVAGGGGLR